MPAVAAGLSRSTPENTAFETSSGMGQRSEAGPRRVAAAGTMEISGDAVDWRYLTSDECVGEASFREGDPSHGGDWSTTGRDQALGPGGWTGGRLLRGAGQEDARHGQRGTSRTSVAFSATSGSRYEAMLWHDHRFFPTADSWTEGTALPAGGQGQARPALRHADRYPGNSPRHR